MSIDYTNETDARIKIDDQLRQAGWDPTNKLEVRTEITTRTASRETATEKYSGPSHQATSTGRADYVLYDCDSRPIAIIEAKRNALDPYRAKSQALPYAQDIGAPFIFLTNGELIYFWDYKNGDARPVHSFYADNVYRA